MSANSPRQPHEAPSSPVSGLAAATASPAVDGRAAPELPPVARDDHIDTTAQPPYVHENAAGDAEALSYPPLDDPSHQLLPPANFSPFFTLVEDAVTGEHHHPAVHYVFSDDDPELHTAVFMRALGDTTATTAPPSPPATRHHPHHQYHLLDHQEPHEAGRHGGAAAAAHILPPPATGVKERYVVLDLTTDGQAVAGATSLSREWQVVGASIAPAPSFAEDNDNDAADGFCGSGALMLRVEGTDMGGNNSSNRGIVSTGVQQEEEAVIAAGLGEARRAAGDDLVGGLEELLRRFDGGIDVLSKVVGPDVEVLVQQQGGGGGGDGGEAPPPLTATADVEEAAA